MTDTPALLTDAPDARPVIAVTADELDGSRAEADPAHAAWLDAARFKARAGEVAVLPGDDGRPARALLGLGDGADPWIPAALFAALPAGDWRLAPHAGLDPTRTAMVLALAGYRFDRYKTPANDADPPRLAWPEGADRPRAEAMTRAVALTRDLVNTPSADMGPAELAEAAKTLAEAFGAAVTVVDGAALERDFPAIHAVGKGSKRAPRLIDLRWGDEAAPRLTLVGKGVCFDTGGLNLKPDAAMKLMKKDMGGAANVLGLASMIMAAALPVRLRVLIPAVENSVSGRAMRPGDVVRARSGKTIEIGHTDAEGRVVLADALALAGEEEPALLIDMATLTGAARAALGPELPALFTDDEDLARAIAEAADVESDPLWRLPMWPGYRKSIDGKIADLTNAADMPFAGAITAALFLKEFVPAPVPWVHIDLFAWNPSARPGRPEGGEAQGIRALFATICSRWPKK